MPVKCVAIQLNPKDSETQIVVFDTPNPGVMGVGNSAIQGTVLQCVPLGDKTFTIGNVYSLALNIK